ncbi:MAG: zinc ribbon domain-containing protein [Acidimicrobiales bacterium]
MFDRLLAVQEHDTAVDRLRHRRRTLPELGELAAVESSVAATEAALAEVGGRRDEAARRQRRHEDELAATEARIAEVDRRLYSGTVTIPRELQAMQADREALRRRQGGLEDEVLEAMGEREPLDEEVAALSAERDRLDGEGARLRAAVAEAQAAIDAELDRETASRADAVVAIPADLASLYERLRARHDGVGAATLVGNRCTGCHLTLPATEIDRIKHLAPDVLVTCDQCGRILVRPSPGR